MKIIDSYSSLPAKANEVLDWDREKKHKSAFLEVTEFESRDESNLEKLLLHWVFGPQRLQCRNGTKSFFEVILLKQ